MEINEDPVRPKEPLPIVLVGAGGIARDAHLPAYEKADFDVIGIVDRVEEKAEELADKFDIPSTYTSAREAVEDVPENVIYDLALLPDQSLQVLPDLPDGGTVLIQKPMGDYPQDTEEIRSICETKNLTAAVNFQLRFAPYVNAARQLIKNGHIGDLYDLEVRITTHMPWEYFPTIKDHERLEILYHSVHYIDLIRSFLGNPSSVMAKTVGHPEKPFSSTRSTIIMEYGDSIHAVINANHDHEFGSKYQESYMKWEGTNGAIRARMGVNLNYPDGVPDKFEYCIQDDDDEPKWQEQELNGSWFPDAFIGTMSSLMRYETGETDHVPTRVEDAFNTMAVVHSAYRSSSDGGEPIENK